jgi:hypothetical protein
MPRGFGPCSAIGLVDEESRPIAGWVFHDYQPWESGGEGTMQISLASDNPAWLRQRKFYGKVVLAYAFKTAKVWKLWTAVPHTKERTLKLCHSFGFTREAMLVDHIGRKQHVFISRMFRKDYERIYGALNNGQEKPAYATAGA